MIIFRKSSHGGIRRDCLGIFTTALRNKKYSQILNKIPHLTSIAYHLLSDRLLGSGVRKWSVQPWAFLRYVEDLEMDNSLRWVLFIKVSGQIISDTLWK